MPHYHVTAPEFDEHRARNFAGIRASLELREVLRAPGYARTAEQLLHLPQIGIRRAYRALHACNAGKSRNE
jgi:hypothetical protein